MKIGLLVGMEDSFPKALIARLEELGGSDVDAHMLSLGGTHHDELCDYDVIVDRVSHDVEFYQSHLRHARLAGTRVLNDPFLVPRDDRFFDCSFATRIGIHVPRTVLLPQKDYPDTVTGASLRNLAWPIPWDEHLEFVGLPAVLRPVGLRGWRHLARIGNRDELLAAYDRTGTTCMMLQEAISWSRYVRCLVFGGDRVIVTRYDPEYRQYLNDPDYVEADLEERIVADAARIATGLGYEMCSVEFAIREDEPVAVEFVNPAPDLERSVITPFFFEKVVETMAAYCLEVAGQGRVVPQVDPFTPGAGLIARISRPGGRGGQKPTAKKAAGKKGVAKKPAGRKPTAKKPAAKKPAAKKPAAKKPAAKKPAAKKPATKKRSTKKPAPRRPAAKKPAAKKPLEKRSSP